jgi:AsmA protein
LFDAETLWETRTVLHNGDFRSLPANRGQDESIAHVQKITANPARIKFAVVTAICLAVLAAGYLVARASILNERTVRLSLVENLTRWTGAKVTIRRPARVIYFPRFAIETGAVEIDGISRLPAIKSIHAKQVLVRLGLWSLATGSAFVDRVTLVEPRIEAAAQITHAGSDPQTLAHIIGAAPFEEFALENGALTVTGPQTTEKFTEMDVKVALQQTDGSHAGRGTFSWRGETLVFDYNAEAPAEPAGATRLPLSLTVGGNLLSARVDGHASMIEGVRIDGKLNLDIPNLASFAKWTGVLVPDNTKHGDLSASGTFHWTGHRIGFDEGSFSLDGNKALGALALDIAGPRPQIEGTLALQRLDLTQYFEPDPKQKAEKTPEKGGQPVEVDFPVLHHVNFDVRISTTELIAGNIRLGQSAAAVTLDAGRFTADLAVFDLCGGSGSSRLEFDATVPDSAILVSTSLRGVALTSCAELFAASSPVDGVADITADLTSNGRTTAEILEKLRGKVALSVSAGNVKLDLERLRAETKNGPTTGWAAALGKSTPFKLLRANVFLRHNSVYTDSLEADLGTSKISGEGTVDYMQKSVDISLEIADQPAEPQSASEAKPETKPAERIVIKGPWSEPSFSRDPAKSSASLDHQAEGTLAAREDPN